MGLISFIKKICGKSKYSRKELIPIGWLYLADHYYFTDGYNLYICKGYMRLIVMLDITYNIETEVKDEDIYDKFYKLLYSKPPEYSDENAYSSHFSNRQKLIQIYLRGKNLNAILSI